MSNSVFLAAPLFNPREREFNSLVATKLREYVDVFLPQEDCGLLVDCLSQGESVAAAEFRISKTDLQAIDRCDILLAILDGAHIDEGVAFEIGYGFAKNKLCVALQTDVRRALPTGNNLMIQSALRLVFSNVEDLINWMRPASKGGPQMSAK
jgi:nucleoside 2-deoxyribosyltransferase